MSSGDSNSAIRSREKPQGLSRLINSFGNSWKGLAGCWREEEAFRQECLLAGPAIAAGLWVGHSGVERALLVGPVFLILIVELLNSAVEAAIDRIGPERHALSGLAKDLGSAAVFMSFLLWAATWALLLLDR